MTNKALAIISKEPRCDVLQFYSKLSGWDVFLVAPEAPKFNLQTLGGSVTHISDEEILPRKIFRANFDASISRQNWYYQQFLKYAVVQRFGGDLLIVDGDSFLNGSSLGQGIPFSSGARYISAYDDFCRHCFRDIKIADKKVFISNFMTFNAIQLNDMFLACGVLDLDGFIQRVSSVLLEKPQTMFSEYQTYARFICANDLMPSFEVKVFRRMDLINKTVESALKKYNVVAYEDHHRGGAARRLRAKIMYAIGMTLN